MQLKLMFSSTPLMAGVCVAYVLFLRARPIVVRTRVRVRSCLCIPYCGLFFARLFMLWWLCITRVLQDFSWSQRLVQAALGFYVSKHLAAWVKHFVVHFFCFVGTHGW